MEKSLTDTPNILISGKNNTYSKSLLDEDFKANETSEEKFNSFVKQLNGDKFNWNFDNSLITKDTVVANQIIAQFATIYNSIMLGILNLRSNGNIISNGALTLSATGGITLGSPATINATNYVPTYVNNISGSSINYSLNINVSTLYIITGTSTVAVNLQTNNVTDGAYTIIVNTNTSPITVMQGATLVTALATNQSITLITAGGSWYIISKNF